MENDKNEFYGNEDYKSFKELLPRCYLLPPNIQQMCCINLCLLPPIHLITPKLYFIMLHL